MNVVLYDIFYALDTSVWDRRYDFITASEVIEHLHHPARELDRLFAALETGGWLAVMTRSVTSRVEFAAWRYIRDLTHVGFYSEATFEWIADRWNAELHLPTDDVALFRKSL